VVGIRVESKQNLAGSAASQDFRDGRSIDAGTAATTIAVGQGALHETAMTVGDIASVTAPNRTMATNRAAKEMALNRSAEVATRDAARVMEQKSRDVQQQVQRTGKILQQQSRTSNLPKGPGPAPLRRGK